MATVARGVALVLLLVLAACAPAARRVPAADVWPGRLRGADQSFVDGCYRCLELALREYEAALAAKVDGSIAPKAYRVAVHLAVRERLLGMYPGAYQTAPEHLAAGAASEDVEAAVDVLSAVPWRRGTQVPGSGLLPVAETLARLRARRASLEAVADTDAWSATLLLTLVGTNPFLGLDEGQRAAPGTQPGLDRDVWWRRHPDDASLSFTRLMLLRSSMEDLATFRVAHPSFVETEVLSGEVELARGRLISAGEAFGRALDEFPTLVPALALRADIRQRMEDYGVAITLYDQLLDRLPDHREALLGRVKSLGFSQRHEDAIATADRMITLGTWYTGEAHYWKAWNLYSLGRLDLARASVDDARRLMVNADLHYLGGVIAFKQARLDDAGTDFDAAIELEGRHCEAHFDRAALRLTRRAWPEAAAGFDEAGECLGARTPVIEQRIVDAREARMAEDARQALVVRREQALRDHHAQIGWARYNAGVAYANDGKSALARTRANEAITSGGPAAPAAERLLPQLPP